MPPKKSTKKGAKKGAKKPAKVTKPKPQPCSCKADKWLTLWMGSTVGSFPGAPGAKPGAPWAHRAFESYVDLYKAIVRLEKLADKQGWPNDSPADRLTDPYGNKAGCPPPPAFP
jgi:hypothetical protein